MKTKNPRIAIKEKWTSKNCVNVKTGTNGSEQYEKTIEWILKNFNEGEFDINVFTIDEHTLVYFLTLELKFKFENNFKPL